MTQEKYPELPPELFRCAAGYIRSCVANENSAEAQASMNIVPARASEIPPDTEADPTRIAKLYDCTVCCGSVALLANNYVNDERCVVTGSCEKSFIAMYPQFYTDESGNPNVSRMPCAGPSCTALLGLTCIEGTLRVEQLEGKCKVNTEGEVYRTKGRHALDTKMVLNDTAGSDRIEDDSMPMTPISGIQDPSTPTAPRTVEQASYSDWETI
jgi:hypothetical protein